MISVRLYKCEQFIIFFLEKHFIQNNHTSNRFEKSVSQTATRKYYLGHTTRIFSLSAMQIKSKCSSNVRPWGIWSERNSGGCGITRKIRPAALNFRIRLLQYPSATKIYKQIELVKLTVIGCDECDYLASSGNSNSCRFAQLAWHWAWLKTSSNCDGRISWFWLKLEHLMQCDVGHPYVAVMVDCHAMREEEQRSAPWIQYLSIGRIQFQNRININWSNVRQLIMIGIIERS